MDVQHRLTFITSSETVDGCYRYEKKKKETIAISVIVWKRENSYRTHYNIGQLAYYRVRFLSVNARSRWL